MLDDRGSNGSAHVCGLWCETTNNGCYRFDVVYTIGIKELAAAHSLSCIGDARTGELLASIRKRSVRKEGCII